MPSGSSRDTWQTFFTSAHGATPNDLLKRGVYSEIATPLKGGDFRAISLALLVRRVGEKEVGFG